jgi:adenosylhomocysteine nucleosidase
MSAFEPELTQLRSQTKVMDVYVINGRTYHVGELAGKQVVLVLSGVSMVNAAMMTQTVLDYFHVDGIIFSGIAGGVNPGLQIGDVVVPARTESEWYPLRSFYDCPLLLWVSPVVARN